MVSMIPVTDDALHSANMIGAVGPETANRPETQSITRRQVSV
jgi:hypothetical protein